VYLYAQEKWGKTSWASYAPKPIFLMTAGETGLLDLINFGQVGPIPHFPEDFKEWLDLVAAVDALGSEKHDYQTLVIDTANGAERLLAEYVLRVEFNGAVGGKNGYNSFGKGNEACVTHWSSFLRNLDRVRTNRRMSIILLAHSKIKQVNNPEGDDYDQLRPEGIEKLWPLTHKWASVIAAGGYNLTVKDDKASGRDRVIRLQPTAAVVAGNRYGLPEKILCGNNPKQAFEVFANALRAARPQQAKAEANGAAPAVVEHKAPQLEPDEIPQQEYQGDPEPIDPVNDADTWNAILARKGTTYFDSIKILNSLTTTGPGKYEAISPSKVISWLDVKLEDREILVRMSKTWKDRATVAQGGSAA
jgi:hypothetical protein